MKTEVISVSTKGQVVLPAAMRKAFGIKAGDHLAVYASDDAIVIKPLAVPVNVEFDAWLDAVRPRIEEVERVFVELDHE